LAISTSACVLISTEFPPEYTCEVIQFHIFKDHSGPNIEGYQKHQTIVACNKPIQRILHFHTHDIAAATMLNLIQVVMRVYFPVQ